MHIKTSKPPSIRTHAILKFLETHQFIFHDIDFNDNLDSNWLSTVIDKTRATMQSNQRASNISWNSKQLQEFNNNADIDLFLFPKSTSTALPPISGNPITNDCQFMNHVNQLLSVNNENDEITKFELKHIMPSKYDKYMIKHLIKTESEGTFWYWQKNREI